MKAFKSGDAIIQFEIKPLKYGGRVYDQDGVYGKIFRISDGKQMLTTMTIQSGIPTLKPGVTVTDEQACLILVNSMANKSPKSVQGLVEFSDGKLVLEPCNPVKQVKKLVFE